MTFHCSESAPGNVLTSSFLKRDCRTWASIKSHYCLNIGPQRVRDAGVYWGVREDAQGRSFPLHCRLSRGQFAFVLSHQRQGTPCPPHKTDSITPQPLFLLASSTVTIASREGVRDNSHFLPPHLLGTGSFLPSKALHIFFPTTGNKCYKPKLRSRKQVKHQ